MAAYSIKEFPEDNGFWRVDWLGKIRGNPDVESEPVIDVHLTRLKDNFADPLANASRTDIQATKPIGIGYLPLLSAGSVWKNGELHSFPEPKSHETISISTSQCASHRFGDSIGSAVEGFSLIPQSHYPVGKHFPSLAESPIAVFPGDGRKFSHCIIPRFELLRFYYICSSKVAHYVWEDALGRAINQHEDKSAILAGNDVRIYLRRDMLDREAYLLARWFVSAVMRKEITSFHNKARETAVNQPIGVAIASHPDIGFPFAGDTTLQAIGKRIKLRTRKDERGNASAEWGFLVLRLLHCSHPLPYRNIIVDRENSAAQGKNKDDPYLPPAWARREEKDGEDGSEEKSMKLGSDQEPQKQMRRKILELFGQQFDTAAHRLIKEEKEVQKYKSARVVRGGQEFVDQYGTGEGTYGKSSSGPLNAVTSPAGASNKSLVTLGGFVKALAWLREEKNWKITTLPLGSEHAMLDGEAIFLYPGKMNGMRSWHLMSREPIHPRGVAVAEVAAAGKAVYLMELERKSNEDAHATLALASDACAAIPEKFLRAFLTKTAQNNRWPKQEDCPRLRMIRLDHSSKDTPERFGRRLEKAVVDI